MLEIPNHSRECPCLSGISGLAAPQEEPQSAHEIPHQQSVTKTTSVFSKVLHFVAAPARFITNLFGRVKNESPDVSAAAQAPEALMTHDGAQVLVPTPIRSASLPEEDQKEAPLLQDVNDVVHTAEEIARTPEKPAEESLAPEQQPQRNTLSVQVGSPVAAEEAIFRPFVAVESLCTTEKLDVAPEQKAEEPLTQMQQVPLAALSGQTGTPPAEEGKVSEPLYSSDESGYETEETVVEDSPSHEQEVRLPPSPEGDMSLNKALSVTERLGVAPAAVFEELRTPEQKTEIAAPIVESERAPSTAQAGDDASPIEEQTESAPEAHEVPAQEVRRSASAVERKKRRHWSNALQTPPLRVCQQGMFRRRVNKIN